VRCMGTDTVSSAAISKNEQRSVARAATH